MYKLGSGSPSCNPSKHTLIREHSVLVVLVKESCDTANENKFLYPGSLGLSEDVKGSFDGELNRCQDRLHYELGRLCIPPAMPRVLTSLPMVMQCE